MNFTLFFNQCFQCLRLLKGRCTACKCLLSGRGLAWPGPAFAPPHAGLTEGGQIRPLGQRLLHDHDHALALTAFQRLARTAHMLAADINHG